MAPTKKTTSKQPKGKPIPISQQILNATAFLSGGTTKHVSRKKVAKLCGFPKTESRSYTNQIGILKNKKGFIVMIDKDSIQLTDVGLTHAEQVAPATDNTEFWDRAKSKLKMNKSKKVFDLLTDSKMYTRAEIALAIGSDHTNRSFQNVLGPLKTLDYMEHTTKNGEKACRMRDEMFPFGRPNYYNDANTEQTSPSSPFIEMLI